MYSPLAASDIWSIRLMRRASVGGVRYGCMTAPPNELVAYHLGIVVHDLQAVAERYQRMLQIDHWRMREIATVKIPWDARSTDARLRVAFGRGAGLTFELIQVLEGRTQHLNFLE